MSSVQSVERTMGLLECFTMQKPSLPLGELAKQTGLPKSTVFRLMSTLIGMGYVKQDAISQRYSLGFKLFYLGSIAMSNTTLRGVSLPHMQSLSEEIKESVTLNIIEQDEKVCIDLVEGPEEIRNFARVGQRNSLLTGSSGKVMLANLSRTEQERIIDTYLSRTNGEHESRDRILEVLERIRRQGYHLTRNDRVVGAFSISVPIFDYTQKLVGAVAASGPIQRLTEELEQELISKVLATARRINQEMGYISPSA